ncbi:MAG: lasso peptide biosynthesis B2 protein [bacterium]
MNRLRKLAALKPREWQWLLISLFQLPLVALLLRFKGYKWTRTRMDVSTASRTLPAQPEQTARAIARMVGVAATFGPYHANCLKIALVAWRQMHKQGIPAQITIGVTKDGDAFDAHAWVEWQGEILVGTSSTSYKPMISH